MLHLPSPPPCVSEYLHAAQYRRQLRANYFSQDGKKLASSRATPASLELPVTGSWRIDDHVGLHGREISVLVAVDPDALDLSEADWSDPSIPNYEGRRDDAERYACWIADGLIPPPIEVVQTDSGTFRVTDGHRRLAAAKLAGASSLLAWISPTMPHPTGLADCLGEILRVGMTFERVPRENRAA